MRRQALAALTALAVVLGAGSTALAQDPVGGRSAPSKVTAPEVTPEVDQLISRNGKAEVVIELADGAEAPEGFRQVPGTRYWVGETDKAKLPKVKEKAKRIEHQRKFVPLNTADASVQTAASTLHAASQDGSGRTIAVIDTGMDTAHAQFGGRIELERCISFTYNACPGGTSFAQGAGTAYPVGSDHGTKVSGVAMSSTRGTAPDATLFPIRIASPDNTFAYTDVLSALANVRDNAPYLASIGKPVVAINLSLGGGPAQGACDSSFLASEVQADVAAGIHVVIATGNDAYTTGVAEPACISAAFTVGAVTGGPSRLDGMASYNNAGAQMDALGIGQVVAPTPGGGEASGQGTSYAAPSVSGLLADLAEARPSSTLAQRERALAESGIIVGDHRVGGGGYARYRPNAVDALARLDSTNADGWRGLGGSITSGPDVASANLNRLDVFARGSAGQLMQITRDGGTWGSWVDLGGSIVGTPAAVSWSPGRIDVVARGTDNAIYHRYWAGTWSGWTSLGGAATSEPDVTSWGSNRLDIFVRGADGAVWHKYWAGAWSGWQSQGGATSIGPGASATNGPDRLSIFARGGDGALWEKRWTGSNWVDWASLGGAVADSPDASRVGLDVARQDAVVRGTVGGLFIQRFDGSAWSGWAGLPGGTALDQPGVASWSRELTGVNLLVRRSDGTLGHRTAKA